jgi:hypothetical protein
MSKYSGVYAPGQAELESLYVEQQEQSVRNLQHTLTSEILFWVRYSGQPTLQRTLIYLLTGDASLGGTLQNLLKKLLIYLTLVL